VDVLYDDDVADADVALVVDVRTSVCEFRARPSTHVCELWMKRTQEQATTSRTDNQNVHNADNNANNNARNNNNNTATSNITKHTKQHVTREQYASRASRFL
jgi:hypothetical protein